MQRLVVQIRAIEEDDSRNTREMTIRDAGGDTESGKAECSFNKEASAADERSWDTSHVGIARVTSHYHVH